MSGKLFCLSWLITLLLTVPIAQAKDIRFYKLNKKGQLNEIYLVRNTSKSGCHNFPLKKKLHRVAQTGFAYCEVFREKDCVTDSRRTAEWKGRARRDKSKQEPTSRLTPGAQWYLDDEENIVVRSWNCVLEEPVVASE